MCLEYEADDEQTSALAGILDVLGEVWPDGKAFTSADVAKLINSPMHGEAEKGLLVKSMLDQVGDRRVAMAVVSATAIAARLRSVADAPVNFGAVTATLKRTVPVDQKHGMVTFRVVRRPAE
jgi:hypothetical protein